MITIIDYGLGNIRAFQNLYNRINIPTKIARNSYDLNDAQKIILPGVGAFDYAMNRLNASGMRNKLEFQVFNNKVPVIGICVGMQILAKKSDEGKMPGLGWIDAEVRLFDVEKINYKTRVPHMGWNTINPEKDSPLLDDLNVGSKFYFLHSYYFECSSTSNVLATTDYGETFSSAVCSDNIYGIQFHPEKSHMNGIRLLQNFYRL